MGFVIDASIAVALIVDEPDSAQVRRLAIRASGLIAPDFLLVEMANALWKFARRPDPVKEAARAERKLPSHDDRVQAAKDALAALVDSHKIDFVDCEKLAVGALELAIDLGHPVYDCVYLSLALAEGVPMVTADRRFLERVRGSNYGDSVIGLDAALART